MDVEEEVLEDGSKMSKGVNCQRKQDHVLVKDAANDCVADVGDALCWVGFVVASELLLFFFSYFCLCESALAVKILGTSLEAGSKIGQGGGQQVVISKPMVIGACVVDLATGG